MVERPGYPLNLSMFPIATLELRSSWQATLELRLTWPSLYSLKGPNVEELNERLRCLEEQFEHFEHKLNKILGVLENMAASVTDIDNALTAMEAEITNLGPAIAKVATDIQVLIGKINQGVPVDLTAELTRIQADTATIAGAVASVNANDAAANPAPAPAPAPAVTEAPNVDNQAPAQ